MAIYCDQLPSFLLIGGRFTNNLVLSIHKIRSFCSLKKVCFVLIQKLTLFWKDLKLSPEKSTAEKTCSILS